MSSPRFEAFLARLYVDEDFLNRFLAHPRQAMSEAALDERERSAAAGIDRTGLMLAARSYRAKRQRSGRARPSLWQRIKRVLRTRLHGISGNT